MRRSVDRDQGGRGVQVGQSQLIVEIMIGSDDG